MAAYNLLRYKRRKMAAKAFVFELPKKNIETLWFLTLNLFHCGADKVLYSFAKLIQ